MPSFRYSRVLLGVLAALSTTQITPAFADDSTSSDNTTQSASTSKKANDVLTVTGSQVTLGDNYDGDQVTRDSRAGMLGNLDFMDTPFSATSYTDKLIRDQQAVSVGDVLLNDPTVRLATGYGNFEELYMIRGFNVYSDDMTLNGVYGILPRQFVAAEMLQRVEVLRGANSFVNGAAPGGSSVGGMVNLVPKRATSAPITRVTVGTQTGGQGYAAMDFGRRFGTDDANGLRVNIVGRKGDTAVDDESSELGMMSLGFDHQGEKFRFSFDMGYQDHHADSPRPSVTPSGAAPSAPSASSNYAQDWTYTDEKQLFGVVRGEYDFTDTTTGWLAFGARHGKEHNLLANPTSDSDGNMTAYYYENTREDNVISADTGVRHQFNTGSIGHSVVLSGSYYHATLANAYTMSGYFDVGSLDDYEQVSSDQTILYSGGDLDDPKVTEKDQNVSVALADTLSMLDDQVKLTLGGRLQRIEVTSYNYDGSYSDSYGANALTPFVGVVYQPTLAWSIYTNYAEGLTPGDVAPGTSGSSVVQNEGEIFKPSRSKQMELGTKYDAGNYGATVAVFQITKPSFITEDIDGSTEVEYTDNGKQRNRGVELSAFGKPLQSVKVLGGVTLTDAKLTNTEDGTNEGNTAIGVPDVMANLNLEWATPFVQNLTLSGRVIYTSSQYIDESNEYKIPAWTRFDLGASYKMDLGKNPLTLRASVQNVANKSYWASTGGYPGYNYLVQGKPRTVVVSASYDF